VEVADPQSSNIRKIHKNTGCWWFFTNPSAKYAHQNGNHLPQVVVKIKTCCQKHQADTVDPRNPAAVDM